MTLINQSFQRIEHLHQQIAALAPDDDEVLASINKQMEALVDIMATHPLRSIEDLALFAYAATWGGEQGPTDEFTKRLEGILRDAGVNPFLSRKARRSGVAGAEQASAEAELMCALAGMNPIQRGTAIQTIKQQISAPDSIQMAIDGVLRHVRRGAA